ncbi:AAA family ATPase [Bradyrhizobium sp. AZCC 1721]|uniref:AAA family ATPase n=1 Tax=Bradyrhizobium sp. AZCC 1721 TaxID=3117016 RepID=UPI002FF2B7CD
MIVFFSVENFRSIRDRQEFSLVPSGFFKEHAETLLRCEPMEGGWLLPSAVIYGPNASGKTNLIEAFRWIKSAVNFSQTRGTPNGGVPRRSFALSPSCKAKPTKIELEFVMDATRYRYGLHATDEAFTEEWLYAFPHGRRQMLFERSAPDEIRFGRTLKGQNKVISELMRPNSLFLSAAAQNGHEQLSKAFLFITSMKFDTTLVPNRASMAAKQKLIDDRIINFLTQIGTGVIGFRATEKEHDADTKVFRTELQALLQRHLPEEPVSEPPAKLTDFELAHQSDTDEVVYLELAHESAGTRRLLIILSSVFAALDSGTALFIDELDASLHTQVGEAVLALFSNPKTNPLGAQLVATTHDTNLMTSSFLRRDQIWFSEKDIGGATHLFPLSDIKTRNTDNIEKGYLQGRYGAIPFSGSSSNLLLVK